MNEKGERGEENNKERDRKTNKRQTN